MSEPSSAVGITLLFVLVSQHHVTVSTLTIGIQFHETLEQVATFFVVLLIAQ